MRSALLLMLFFQLNQMGSQPKPPAEFLSRYIAAVNAATFDDRLAVIHPAFKACILGKAKEFYRQRFSRESKPDASCAQARIEFRSEGENISMDMDGGCTLQLKTVPRGAPLLGQDQFDYRVRPTHTLVIGWAGHSKFVQLVHGQAGWSEALPCPKPQTLERFRSKSAQP